MVAVELNGIYIDAEPLKVHNAKELSCTYNAIMSQWRTTVVISPNWHILDNEAPVALKQATYENGCCIELTPADMHGGNATEKAIQMLRGNLFWSLLELWITFQSVSGTSSSHRQYSL